MSKDRQQRREQQASVTKTGDQITVTAQPTSTGKDVEAAVAEFERAASAASERAPDRTPAEIIEHAERLSVSPPTGEQIIERRRQEEAALRRIIPQFPIDIGPGETVVLMPGEHSHDGARLLVGQAVKATLAPDGLEFFPLHGGSVEVQVMTPERHSAPANPPANIPKAVHHLRRAANALPGDALRAAFDDLIRGVLADGCIADEHRRMVADIASALEMDAHGGAQAAKDVRAAIEALS